MRRSILPGVGPSALRLLPLLAAPSCAPSASAGPSLWDGGGDGVRGAFVRDGGAGLAANASPGSPGEIAKGDDAVPTSAGEDFSPRARHLVEAIAQDNAHLATDILFPRDGFLATREMGSARGWERTVQEPFHRAVHTLHKRMPGLDRAQFINVELGHAITQITPKRKEWKAPLWRVRHSRITVLIDGKAQRIDLPEMVGWRGAWYVTKLK